MAIKETAKKITKKIVFRALYYSGLIHLLRFLNRKKVIIVGYHGVSKENLEGKNNFFGDFINKDLFEKHLRLFRKMYNPINQQDFIDWKEGRKKLPDYPILITFDDGYKDILDVAAPITERYGLKPVMFFCSGLAKEKRWLWPDLIEHCISSTAKKYISVFDKTYSLGSNKCKRNFYIEILRILKKTPVNEKNRLVHMILDYLGAQKKSPVGIYELCSLDNIKSLRKRGFSIGNHGYDHEILTEMDIDVAESNIKLAECIIKKLDKGHIPCLSYPNGSFNRDVIEMLKQNRFSYAITTDEGFNTHSTNRFALKRFLLGNEDDYFSFWAKLSGLKIYLKKLI